MEHGTIQEKIAHSYQRSSENVTDTDHTDASVSYLDKVRYRTYETFLEHSLTFSMKNDYVSVDKRWRALRPFHSHCVYV